jgi:glycosyltransferase involved in cell wall biosynthesis
MKVLFISEYFPPNVKGGGEISCFLLAKHLIKRGVEIHVLTSNSKGSKEIEGINIHRNLKTGKNPSSIFSNIKRTLAFPNSVKKETKKLIRKYNFDIIHYFNTTSAYGVIKTKIPKIMHSNSPVFFCPKGDLIYKNKSLYDKKINYRDFKKEFINSKYIAKTKNYFFIKHNPIFRRYLFRAYKKRIKLLKKFDHFLPISNFLAGRLKLLGVKENKITVMPNIIEIEKFKKTTAKNDKLRITYLGSYTKFKGIYTLLKALKKLKRDYVCNLYGAGNIEQEIKKRIEKDNLKVNLNTKRNYQKIPEVLSKSNVLVFPSEIPEAFGRVLVEAMAAGCIPVSSKIGGTIDIIKDKKNGYFFEPGNIEQLTEILNKIDLRKIKKEVLIKEAKKYNGEDIAKKVLTAYKKITNENLNVRRI